MIGYVFKKSDYIIVGKITGNIKVFEDRLENENKDAIKNISGKFDYFITDNDSFNIGDTFDSELIFEEYKNIKLQELSIMCKDKISSTFVSSALGVPHVYSYDDEAKDNLKDTIISISSGLFSDTTTLGWRIHDTREIIPHTKNQLIELYTDSIVHKQTILASYRETEQLIKNTTRKEDIDNIINNINW